MMRHIFTRQLTSLGLPAHLVLFVAASSLMLSAFAAPPTVSLASEPLYSGGGNVRPNLLLDLSVEFPTVKAAYTNASDYSKAVEYIGYFNSKKCYVNGGFKTFSRDKNGNLITSRTVSTSDMANGYFSISKDADANYECGGNSFSGNFMNWASSSSIDMLRLSLTGGDRIVDSSSQTVLQRAYLPDFYNSGYFRRKVVVASATMSAPRGVTPYDVATLYVLNCNNKIMFTDVNVTGGCGTQRTYPNNDINSDTRLDVGSDRVLGEFLVRVQVCDAQENTSRTDLCLQYPNGTYKPVGQMQRNQNSVRYGAFGYLMDNVNTRYGGVLRAPLKYVGSKQYRATNGFAEEVNTRPEWNPLTGIYYDNPENDATGNSGVINYLNKFGRTGSYKGYDPLGELYYESIRYLQGKAPTSSAISGITAAMQDNFQVLTNWTDPIEASCQKNYIIAIGDANTHQDTFIPGGTLAGAGRGLRPADAATSQWPAFDAKAQTALVAAMESSSSSGNSAPVASLANMASAYTGSSGATFYMVGTAYWARNNDIRLDKPVRVKTFTIDVDENGNGSIDNTARANTGPRVSQLYLTAKYGGFSDLNLDKNPFMTFDSDGKTAIANNKEWASGNGTDPDNFFLASNPKRMMAAINSIFQTVASSGGTLAGVGISSTSSSDNPFVYEPGFKAEKWSGSLKKLSATAANPSAVWDAGVILTGDPVTKLPPNPLPADRKIYTSKISADGSLALVSFSASGTGNFSASDLAALNTDPHTGITDNLASDRIQYLRGVRTLEQGKDASGNTTGKFRTRDSVLGDIVNSAPVYYGAPAKNVTGVGYSEFYSANKNRQTAVYVGSNDGMLHAFDAVNGQEIFSYIPNALISSLNELTDPYYSHSSYVDGRITVKEAQVNGVWKTLLVAGMGAGNKGVFALDVTNPANFSGGIGALWEFTDKVDKDMGYVLSPPMIAKFRTGGTATSPTFGNFVVISSGYNNYDYDVNATGQGALFILSLDKRPSDPWVRGSNYFKLMTPIKDSTAKNGLGAPNVAYGPNGAVSYAYAGDLQGNLWRFDFTAGSLDKAKVASKPVFTAKNSSGAVQPITVQPQIVFAPGGGYILTFGTGKYMETFDVTPSNYMSNSYYAILDTTYDSDVVASRSELEPRTLTADGSGFRIGGNKFVYGVVTGTKKGWYLDFSNSQNTGERIHHTLTGTLAGNYLFFNTLILSSDPCSGGSGRKYAVDVLTGMNNEVTGTISTIGLLTSPIVINISTSSGDRTGTGARRITTKISVRTAGTGNSSGITTENSAAADAVTRAGRISWQEIRNWQELKKAATAGGS